MNKEFNLLHHVGVVAKRLRAAAAGTRIQRGRQYLEVLGKNCISLFEQIKEG